MLPTDPVRPLLALARAAGGYVDGITAGESHGERGLFATRTFDAGDTVLAVPPALLVASPSIAATPLGGAVTARWGGDAHPTLLGGWLVRALPRRDGPIGAYMATLPASLDHLPLFYDDRRRAALRGTSFATRVEVRRAHLLAEHAWLVAEVPGMEGVTEAGWLHARSLVTSRTFSCDGGEALAPIADLVNHAPDPGTRWTCDARDGLVVRATRPIAPGEEIRVSYGLKSNARTLLAYGFTVPDNPIEDMEILLGELGAFRLEADDTTAEAERLLAALDGYTRDARARARGAVADLCRSRLEALPTDTPEERADPALGDALAVRASERRILGYWANLRS